MKRLLAIFFALLPLLLNAGIIQKKSGETIDNVTIKSKSDTEVVYVTGEGEAKSIPLSEVSAILYDDGRYEEIRMANKSSMNTSEVDKNHVQISEESVSNRNPNAKAYNVYAYGVYLLAYIADSKYDGATVEYRIIYKSQSVTPEFQYYGTTPFAYLTQKFYAYDIKPFNEFKSVNPLVLDNATDVQQIEFRLSLAGYETVIVKPIKMGGCDMFIPLQKLKPIK